MFGKGKSRHKGAAAIVVLTPWSRQGWDRDLDIPDPSVEEKVAIWQAAYAHRMAQEEVSASEDEF
jgi:hypothetical protein